MTISFYVELKNNDSKDIYDKANRLSQKITRILYFFMNKVSVNFVCCSKFIISFVAYFTTDLGNDAFGLPYPARSVKIFFEKVYQLLCSFQLFSFKYVKLKCDSYFSFPFNWRSPIAYQFAFAHEYLSGFHISFQGTLAMTFIIGACLMLISLANDITKDIYIIDEMVVVKKQRKKLLSKISKFIQFHSDAQQLSEISVLIRQNLL